MARCEPGLRQVGEREDVVQNRDGGGGMAGLNKNVGLDIQARHVIRRPGKLGSDDFQGVCEIAKGEISAQNTVQNVRVIGMLLQNRLEGALGAGEYWFATARSLASSRASSRSTGLLAGRFLVLSSK